VCSHEGCPGYDPNDERDDDEPDPRTLRVECSTGTLEMLRLLVRGWNRGAQGLLGDLSDKYGFAGLTRIVYVLNLAVGLMPGPENPPDLFTDGKKLEAMLRADGRQNVTEMMAAFRHHSDQAKQAFAELTALGAQQREHEFNARFDTITDVNSLIQPLVEAFLHRAATHYDHTLRHQLTPAMDQFQAALRHGMDLNDVHPEAAQEIADLNRLLDMDVPDSQQ
jgi:hypothetical protein